MFSLSNLTSGEPDSSVSAVSGCGLDDRAIEVRSLAEAEGFFLYPLCPDRLWGPLSLLYKGTGGPFPGAKARSGRDADHSPPSSAEVKNEWELYLVSPNRLHGVWWDSFSLER
jgi:hypothetical protein